MGHIDLACGQEKGRYIADLPARLYWGFQATFWMAVFLWRTVYTWAYGYGFDGVFLRLSSMSVAVLTTIGLSILLARLVGHRLQIWQFAVIGALTLVIGIVHTVIDRLIFASAKNGWVPTFPESHEYFQILSVNAWVFLSWTGFFLVILVMTRARRKSLAYERMSQFANEAKLQMLTSQLNPHFLLNTLNSVSALIVEGRTKEADLMVTRLGRFLNRVIKVQQMHKTSLKDEIALITDYLEIQKIRFGDRLSYAFDIDPECEPHLTPALILQPIVENAVQHGIANRVDGGLLQVKASRSGEDLRVEVTDDGEGFDPRRIATGLGLSIVQDRLNAHYGDAARLEIETSSDLGTHVVVELPIEDSETLEPESRERVS